MPTIQANGAEFNVEISGDGPPVLALHGWADSAATWHSLTQAIGAEFSVYAVDLLGHGASSRPPDPERYAMEHLVDDMRVVLDELGHSAVHVLGHSMGARVGLGLALAAPERCRAVLLESAAPGGADDAERSQLAASDEAMAKRLGSDGMEAFVDYLQSLTPPAVVTAFPKEERDALRDRRLANDPAALAASLRGAGEGAQPPLLAALPSLAMPALFLVGELDTRHCEAALEMAAAVPVGRVTMASEAGHTVHLERPEAFNETVLDFLRRQEGR